MLKIGDGKFAERHAGRRRGVLALVFAGLICAGGFGACSRTESDSQNAPPAVSENANAPENSVAPPVDPNLDFSKFDHQSAEHARFPCALCHERSDGSATPKLPGHMRCASCHAAQFADRQSAICTICHKTPETGEVKAFPALKSFNARFDHAKHLRQTNCASCHKPIRNGEALSIPAGLGAHNSCFGCHTPDATSGETPIGSCNTCHLSGTFGGPVSTRAKAYTATPFSHASHRQACTACHTVKRAAPRGRQLTAPVAAMHFAPKNVQSCASCHDNRRAFGGDDTNDCRRCHRGDNYGVF